MFEPEVDSLNWRRGLRTLWNWDPLALRPIVALRPGIESAILSLTE